MLGTLACSSRWRDAHHWCNDMDWSWAGRCLEHADAAAPATTKDAAAISCGLPPAAGQLWVLLGDGSC